MYDTMLYYTTLDLAGHACMTHFQPVYPVAAPMLLPAYPPLLPKFWVGVGFLQE